MGKLAKHVAKNNIYLLMVLPATLWFIIFKYVPMLGNVLAFQRYTYSKNGLIDGILHSKWIGLENFKYLFSTQDAFIITRNTILYNLAFIAIGLVIPVSLSIIISGLTNRRLSKVYQTGMIMPHFLSWVVVGYFVFAFLSMDKGFLNSVLEGFGLRPQLWYTEPHYWPYILILTQSWKSIGYSSIIYLAAIAGIDKTYYEAAVIDGAGKWQQIRHVTIPHLQPLMIILTILAVGQIFHADFGLFYFIPRESGVLFQVTNVIDTYVYRSLKNVGSFGMSAAAGLYQSLVGFVLVIVANLIVRKISKDDALF